MPVPVDPYPDFVPGTVANPDQLDARLLALYRTLDPAAVGIDDSNVAAAAAIKESKLAAGANGLARGCFSVYRAAAFSAISGDRVPFDTEEWDVSAWHDPTAGVVRFMPLAAGWYRLNGLVTAGAALVAGKYWRVDVYRNGVEHRRGQPFVQAGTPSASAGVSCLAQADGVSDFFDLRVFHDVGVAQALAPGASLCYFQGELVGRT